MKKTTILSVSILILFLVVLISSKEVLANSELIPTVPMFNSSSLITLEIYSHNNNILEINCFIKAKYPNSSIFGTVFLEKYHHGKWVVVKSWNFNDVNSISFVKSYKTNVDSAYRARTSGFIEEEEFSKITNIIKL
ncbi:hypothetical protein [Neofamilia massiliensis]|uniref:hypothetical protein n=1 Tax=Neofamilia massiliensis TaxID=1673724 RepID=UPI0006BB73D9|nr:hypothetical protein [Neofamilia massiliensis]